MTSPPTCVLVLFCQSCGSLTSIAPGADAQQALMECSDSWGDSIHVERAVFEVVGRCAPCQRARPM